MAYNSSHTGAQIDSAVGTVIEKESIWDGKGTGDMLASVYDPKGKEQDVFQYADAKASEAKSVADTAQTGLNTHIASKSNPHGVTAAQVGADAKGAADTALTNAKKYTDQKIAAIPTPDVSGQIETHNTAENAHSALFAAKQDKITVTGVLKCDGDGGVSAAPIEKWTFALEDGSTVTKKIVLG